MESVTVHPVAAAPPAIFTSPWPLDCKFSTPAVPEMVPAPAKVKAEEVTPIVSTEATPVRAPPVVTFNPLLVNARVPVPFPMATFPDPAVSMFTLTAPVVPRLVVPVEVKVVKAPVEAVVAPMAVELIPVPVVVK